MTTGPSWSLKTPTAISMPLSCCCTLRTGLAQPQCPAALQEVRGGRGQFLVIR